MGATAQFNTRVDPDLKAAFAKRAARRGETVSAATEAAMTAYLKRRSTDGDLPGWLAAALKGTPAADGRGGSGYQGRKTSLVLPADLDARIKDLGWSLPQVLRLGTEAAEALERAREAENEPARPAPKSRARASAVGRAARAVDLSNPRAALRALQSVPAATMVFQEPGGTARAGHPVPAAADQSRKRGLR